MKKLLIESQFLPPIEFFCLVDVHDEIVIEVQENYVKQTFRNRAQILGPNGVQTLIVPVNHDVRNMGEVTINYQQKWWKEHWRTLETAYNKSPYMLYYREELNHIFFEKCDKLVELNTKLMSFCLNKLGVEKEITFTENYNNQPNQNDFSDYRQTIKPKQGFAERGIYHPVPYFQQFGKGFAPNLSIIDLLMMNGPESILVIRNSQNKNLNK